MFLEKPQLVHQPPSALLGSLRPSGQPLALCSASQKRLRQVRRCCARFLTPWQHAAGSWQSVGRCVSCGVLLAACNSAQRECGSPCEK